MKQYLYRLATDREKGIIAGIFKAFLFFISLLYGLIMCLCRRISLSGRYRPPCKVISIGNITWGGTGKTSLVKWILGFLQESGKKTAVLLRGYGRRDRGRPFLVQGSPQRFGIEAIGDEAYMLAEEFPGIPILIDRSRKRASNKAYSELGVDTVILDDGFQHWRLHRDIDIVLINANNPFGNGHLIPRGILREPPSSLRRSDVILLTKTDLRNEDKLINRIKNINPYALIVYAKYIPQYFYNPTDREKKIELDLIRDKPVCVFSGIGDPESFEKTIADCGAHIDLRFRFPDHHYYSEKEIKEVREKCQRVGINTVITSQKDAVRIKKYELFEDLNILVLKAELTITENKDAFIQRLLSLYTT